MESLLNMRDICCHKNMKGLPCTEEEVKEAEATLRAMEEIRRKEDGKTSKSNQRTKGRKKSV